MEDFIKKSKKLKQEKILEDQKLIDISLEYLKGSITLADLERAVLDRSGGIGGYVVFTRGIRAAFAKGKLTIK